MQETEPQSQVTGKNRPKWRMEEKPLSQRRLRRYHNLNPQQQQRQRCRNLFGKKAE
jgi:hypothetical protein